MQYADDAIIVIANKFHVYSNMLDKFKYLPQPRRVPKNV